MRRIQRDGYQKIPFLIELLFLQENNSESTLKVFLHFSFKKNSQRPC